MSELTHFDASGNAHMVDVGGKDETERSATARGTVHMAAETFALIRDGGVNLIDTAEQYPIPSDDRHPEGLAETTIGKWLAKDKSLRDKTVIATKITGGQRISGKSIISACENRRAPPPPTCGRTPRAPATAPQREPPPLHSPPRAQPAAPRHGLHRRVPVPLARALHPAVELGAGSLSEPCTAAPVTLNPAPHRLSS